jgi:hypothetical protein
MYWILEGPCNIVRVTAMKSEILALMTNAALITVTESGKVTP